MPKGRAGDADQRPGGGWLQRFHTPCDSRAPPVGMSTGLGRMPESPSGWSREFDEPISLPGHGALVFLRDAASYITALPEEEASAPEWQAAIEALMLVVELNGPTMFTRIGIMQALNATFASSIQRGRMCTGARESSRETNDRFNLREHQQGSWRQRSPQSFRERRRRPDLATGERPGGPSIRV